MFNFNATKPNRSKLDLGGHTVMNKNSQGRKRFLYNMMLQTSPTEHWQPPRRASVCHAAPLTLVFRALFVWRIPNKFLTSVSASNFHFSKISAVF